MTFRVIYHHEVEFDLEGIDARMLARIRRAIETRLTTRPDAYGKPLRFTLKGLWSLRVGDYRVIYRTERVTVVVLKIGHRRDVYEAGEERA